MRSSFIASFTVAVLFAPLAASCTRDSESPLAAMAGQALRGKDVASAIPILRVANLQKATAYWRDALGFKVEWQDGDPPDFAAVTRGDAIFFMCQQCQGAGASWSFVFVKNVDTLHKELVAKGAIIKMPPKDEPWNLREMHVADPDGNVVRFGSALPH